MGAGKRKEVAGKTMTTTIKDKLGHGVDLTKKKAHIVVGQTKNKAENIVMRVIRMIYSSIESFLTFVLIVALSVFLYATFYYTFMPLQLQKHPVRLQFEPCRDGPGVCSYPNASVSLNKKIILSKGQPYSISLGLEVPESTKNLDLGMFMACMDIDLEDGSQVSSCQYGLLEFKSQFLNYLETFVLAPLFVSGTSKQKQQVLINFFSGYFDDPQNSATNAHIQIQSKYLQVYSSEVLIFAEFTGLRRILIDHPWFSSCAGVFGNFILLSAIILSSRFGSTEFPSEEVDDIDQQKSGLQGRIIEETDLSSDEDILESEVSGTRTPNRPPSATCEES